MSTKQDIKRHEGVVYGIYLDSLGKPTAGVGHLINNKSDLFKSKAKQIKKLTSAFNNRLKELQESLPDLNENELIKLKAQIAKEINSNIAGFRQVKGENNVATYVTNDEFSLSPEKVEKTFEVDFNEKGVEQAKRNFPNYEKFPPNIQNALVNMSYQLGTISTKEWPSFHSALNYGLKTQDYTHAAHHAADSRWFNQTKRRAMEVTDMMGGIAKEPLSKKEMDSYIAPPKPRPEREEEKIDIKLDVPEIVVETPEVPSLDLSGLLQEELKMPVPTNPEAGPSDTVRAMLTPGEAVIPAAAAQNPENKEKIQELLVEGRVKNDVAEANGVPVTSQTIAEIPKERLYDNVKLDEYHRRNLTGKYGGGEQSLQGFAGGTMNIPKGMHMMPDGSLMKDEDHKGYGHGTMDVPAMLMMVPPKDPAMDEMEKLAIKQMGYEMKSKNRTRDTIEKIGLKHLEDTADANMKQAALDETMKNYGMEVPMPMQPVPQGFQDGTPGLYDERPSLSFGQQILSGIAGPKTDLYDDKTDAELAEIARFGGSELEMSAAQRELSRRQAQTPVGAELEMPAEGTDIKIAGSDISIPAPETVPEKDLTQPKVETPDDGSGDGSGFGKAVGAFFSSLGSSLADTAKQVFDPTSIGRAAMTFTTLRLMGMPARASGQYALNAYQTGQRQFAETIKQKGLTDRASINQSSANYTKLQNDITKQLKAVMSEKELQETAAKLGVTTEVLASTLISNLQDRGYNDISSAEALGQVTDIANIAVNTFRNDLRKGVVSNDLGAVLDRSLTSVVELGDAFADVTPEVQNTLFTGIRRNIPEKLKGMKGTEELRNRVSDIYQYYKNNREKVAELNLRAPGVGENEFTVFLEAVLDQGGIRTVV